MHRKMAIEISYVKYVNMFGNMNGKNNTDKAFFIIELKVENIFVGR